MAKIIVDPEDSLADEPVRIKVIGLKKYQKITIQACQTSDKGKDFHSYAFYIANEEGDVDVSIQPSSGGYYTGIEPMALLWTMKRLGPKTSYSSLAKTGTEPNVITLSIFDGHQKLDNLIPFDRLTSTKMKRIFVGPNVDRVLIKEDDFIAIMFVPKQNKKFLGVVDIGGVNGGGFVARAALLANHGFVVMCIILFGGPDQPKSVSVIDIGCVEKGVDRLLANEKVKKDGVAMIGISFGGSLALATAGCLHKIKCVVSVSGLITACGEIDLRYGNKIWISSKQSRDILTLDGNVYESSNAVTMPTFDAVHKHIPDFHKSRASLLLIYGEDDRFIKWKKHLSLAEQMLKYSGKKNYVIKTYSGCGHLIGPPYHPLTKVAYYDLAMKYPSNYGGIPKEHELGQEQSWKDIISFLKENSVPTSRF